jgi:hypothetical protein
VAPPDEADGDAAVDSAPPPPALPPGRSSSRDTVRRAVLVGAVLVAIALFVIAGLSADTDTNDEVGVSGDIVERLIPARDEEALRQTPVGLDLSPGWGLSRLTINGVDTREDEWDVTAALGLYQYRPASGQTVEALHADRNCASAEIFQLADLTNTRVIDWCFTIA